MAVQNSTKKWVFIGGGLIAAAALVVFFQNYPPTPKDATGTIGAAQRYHSTQVTGDDVKVNPTELTTWMQSETFDRIVKDPEARKLFASEGVATILRDSMQRQAAIRMGTDDSFRVLRVIDNAQTQIQLAHDSLQNAIKAHDATSFGQATLAADLSRQIMDISNGLTKAMSGPMQSSDVANVQLSKFASELTRLSHDLATLATDAAGQAGPKYLATDAAGQAGPKYLATDAAGQAGPKYLATDAAAQAGPKSLATDAAAQAGPKYLATDAAAQAGPKYLATDAIKSMELAHDAVDHARLAVDGVANARMSLAVDLAGQAGPRQLGTDAVPQPRLGTDVTRIAPTMTVPAELVKAAIVNPAIWEAVKNDSFCAFLATDAAFTALKTEAGKMTGTNLVKD